MQTGDGEENIFSEDEILAQLEEGGAIANRIPYYESREGQLELMRLVIRGFNQNAVTAAEAGTGVGKSFAYLLPAIHYVGLGKKQDEQRRIVISTATINLQQQLFEKDIPFLFSACGINGGVKAALVKGRGNFLCMRRLRDLQKEAAAQQGLFTGAEANVFESFVEWAEATKTGEKTDAPFVPNPALWMQTASDSDSCMNARCPYFAACFYMKNRREAAQANILVVNHHVLFADLAARYEGAGYDGSAVLPAYERIILDEAHRIEDSATSFFSGNFSRPALNRRISRLYRHKTRGAKSAAFGGAENGLLVRLRAYMKNIVSTEKDAALAGSILETLVDLDDAGLDLCGIEAVFRFVPGRDGIIQSRLIPPLQNLRSGLLAFCAHIDSLLEPFGGKDEPDAALTSLLWEIRAANRYLQSLVKLCEDFINYREAVRRVLWIERRRTGNSESAVWTSAPLEVGAILKDALFTPFKSVIAVSATLSVDGRFDYWLERAGLQAPALTGCFPSPFPYRTAVLLAVPVDAPPVTGGKAYQNFVNNAVLRLCRVSGGGALVLFTSYDSLRQTYASCAGALAQAGIAALKQGDDDRARLLKAFVEDESSVLFATDSFWEGVDAPGETLRLLIICRLPFASPSDPVPAARCEALERAGKNPFMELSVPEAVMKFRQGFGRLMRRSTDRGVVAVLDSRIVNKFYGRRFFAALPETKQCIAPFAEIERAAEIFLNG
ncbi:MAG: ATP-dependent DNA helicase DinG [Spirochaetaceae bacterium]|jgi:ATP-dependent DNA helicase DinG|nr:ATP-dependent DNA helicase DinG [Spirochaetaceae bacterium]